MKPSCALYKNPKLVNASGSTSDQSSSNRRRVVYQRKLRLQRLRLQEIQRLRSVVPQLSAARRKGKSPSEIEVVTATMQYINQLQSTVLARLAAGTLAPESVNSVHSAFLANMIQSFGDKSIPIRSLSTGTSSSMESSSIDKPNKTL